MAKTPVFISWSKPRAEKVAVALSGWLRKVLQACDPWCSPEMDAGERWSPRIAARLSESSVGVIVVTPENHAEPWLLFEAGAISKSVQQARVIPFYVGLRPTDITGPLTQFQGKVADKAGTLDVLKSVNASLHPEDQLSDADLADAFDTWWPKLEEVIEATQKEKVGDGKTGRKLEDKVEEVLTLVRDIHRRPMGGHTYAPPVVPGGAGGFAAHQLTIEEVAALQGASDAATRLVALQNRKAMVAPSGNTKRELAEHLRRLTAEPRTLSGAPKPVPTKPKPKA